MDDNRLGLIVGLLLVGFAIATIAAGLTLDHWTNTVAVGRPKLGQM